VKLNSPFFSISLEVLSTEGMEQKTLAPILVGIRQSAELLNVCPRTVQNLIVAKRLRARKLGRRTLISYRDLLEFARHDHATTSTTAPEQVQ
jgi:excisionase family DNA binding protein